MLDQCLTNVIARTMALQAPAPGRARRFEDLSAGCGGMTVVEDFGDMVGHAVDIGDRIVDPARRWAVVLDAGGLVFVDSDQLVAE